MRTNLLTDLLIRALGLVRLLITPLILSTTEYGELGLISAIFLYANFADLGLQVHFEIISSMEPQNIKKELNSLFKKLIPRLIFSGLILSAIVYYEFHSRSLALWSLVFVFTLNIDTLFQIILRQQKIYQRLALSLFLQALFLTALLAPAALYFRLSGILALQALAPLLSIILNVTAIKSLLKTTSLENPNRQNQAKADHQQWNAQMTFWLLLGQVELMIWITADRFFLSKTITMSELGLWNLGNMAGSILLGFANTWGTLKLPLWKKEQQKLFDPKFFLIFSGIYLAGVLGLFLSTHFVLIKYRSGLNWNLLWLTITYFISLVFILDAYTRSQTNSYIEARAWFIQKLLSLISGALTAWIAYQIFSSDARIALCFGVMISCMTIYTFCYLKFKKLSRS